MDTTSISTVPFSVTIETRFSDILKRAFDLCASLVGLILLSPFFALIAYAIKRDTPGPVFYRGPRVGRGGKEFKILKFRTMYERPQSYSGPRVTAHDDARITPIGHWLRNTKLNELPQLWNVLIGEMSLVGPRPEDPEFAKSWPKPVREEVLSVRPGITSPASVQYRDEEKLLSAGNVTQKYMTELGPDKMRLDQLYVRYRSFWLDLDTILWTLFVLIPKIGSYSPPENLLFVGPVSRVTRRYLNWFTIDTLITFFVIGATGVFLRLYGPLDIGWPKAIAGAIWFSLLFSISEAILGVNRISWSKARFRDMFDLFPSWLLATVVAFLWNRLAPLFPLRLLLPASVFALVGFILARYRSRLVVAFFAWIAQYLPRARTVRERVLIVGSDLTAQHAAWLFDHPMNTSKFKVVGFADDDLLKQGMRIYGANVIGTTNEIQKLVEKYDVGLIILAGQDVLSKEFRSLICRCKQFTARVVVLPDILSALSGLTQPFTFIPQTGNEDAVENEWVCEHCLAHQAQSNQQSA